MRISGEPVPAVSKVEIVSPQTGFGALRVSIGQPRIQLLADYGVLTTDVQTFTSGGGTTTSANSMFVASIGTTVGAFAAFLSRRMVRYRAGSPVRILFTAMYSTPVALSTQFAGGYQQTEGLLFGYSGTQFGVLRRIAGTMAIKLLTITVGAGASEVVTLTLNGVAFVLPATGGALSTNALASFIADQTSTTITGWTGFQAQAIGATVQFFQDVPGTTPGAFTMSSSGTAAGTWSTVQAGTPNDDTEASGAFIPQTSWNVDKMDGHGPSGMVLDPSKLNVFEIMFTYLGGGPPTFSIMGTDGHMHEVHRIEYPNNNTTPSLRQPSLRIGWSAASLGSTTALTVSGASAAAFLDGELTNLRDPFSSPEASVVATTSEVVLLAIRVRGEFGGVFCHREIAPILLSTAAETLNRVCYVRCVLNPVISGTLSWARVGTTSAVDWVAPTGATRTGGTLIAPTVVSGGSSRPVDLVPFGIRCEAGDVIAICVQMLTLTSTVTASLAWHET